MSLMFDLWFRLSISAVFSIISLVTRFLCSKDSAQHSASPRVWGYYHSTLLSSREFVLKFESLTASIFNVAKWRENKGKNSEASDETLGRISILHRHYPNPEQSAFHCSPIHEMTHWKSSIRSIMLATNWAAACHLSKCGDFNHISIIWYR